MSARWILLTPLAIMGILFFIVVGGGVVLLLWNWLLPPLFGLPAITFLQALGLLALCRILFGGFSSGGRARSRVRDRVGDRVSERVAERMGQRVAERMRRMTPEQRDRFREGLRSRMDFDPFADDDRGS